MKWTYLLSALLFYLMSVTVNAEEAPMTIKGVITINTHQAKLLHELGVPFVDVRSHSQWQWGHVDGAHNLDLREGFQQLFIPGALDKNAPVVIYGNSTYHMRGAIASYLAVMWGYKQVFFFRDGYFSWLAMDHPVTLTSDNAVPPQVTVID